MNRKSSKPTTQLMGKADEIARKLGLKTSPAVKEEAAATTNSSSSSETKEQPLSDSTNVWCQQIKKRRSTSKSAAQPKVEKKENSPDLRIFVKNLSPHTTKQTVKDYFGRWGVISDVYIRQTSSTFRGIRCLMAYITFTSYFRESPLSIPVHVIDEMSVPVSRMEPQIYEHEHEKVSISKTLMVSGPIHKTTDEELKRSFGKYGNILGVSRKPDPDHPGHFFRYAFIRFNTTGAVEKAMSETIHTVNGTIVDVRRVADI